MKKVTYPLIGGRTKTIEYDEKAPCICCRLPVESASMGGTDVCPWCDCGQYRDGTKQTLEETLDKKLLRKRAKEIYDKRKKEADLVNKKNHPA